MHQQNKREGLQTNFSGESILVTFPNTASGLICFHSFITTGKVHAAVHGFNAVIYSLLAKQGHYFFYFHHHWYLFETYLTLVWHCAIKSSFRMEPHTKAYYLYRHTSLGNYRWTLQGLPSKQRKQPPISWTKIKMKWSWHIIRQAPSVCGASHPQVQPGY